MVQLAFTKTNIANFVLRLLQFIAAIVVIALYGIDLHRANRERKYSDSKWGYAVAVGSISAITSFILIIVNLFILYQRICLTFVWDVILVVLWTVVSGIFGSMYLPENAEMESAINRMKTAVGFDLASLCLWFFSAVFGAALFFMGRGGKTQYTGRATTGRVAPSGSTKKRVGFKFRSKETAK